MNLTHYKSLFFTGAALIGLSLSTYAQSTNQASTKGSDTTSRKRGYTTPRSTQAAAQSQSNINEAGSSAQVRHDRTGSLDPGHAKTGKPNAAGPGDNNQGKIGEP